MKRIYIILGLVVLVILILFSFMKISNKNIKQQEEQVFPSESVQENLVEEKEEEKGEEKEEEKIEIKIETPEMGATSVPEDVAVPSNVAPSPSGESSFRMFNISISNKKYTPSIIVVNEMDVITLKIRAVDDDYSFEIPNYGISATIKKETERQIQFQATSVGSFKILCNNCKDGVGGMLVVNPKK